MDSLIRQLVRLLFGSLMALNLHAQTLNTPVIEDRIFFIGDSTMATKNGYGDYVCESLKGKADCFNLARNGRSTKSFREEGLWQQALEQMKSNPKQLRTWVLIQFGHNDQPGKPGRSTSLVTEYPQNLEKYVAEARAIGARPVLVTPLIRRSFKNGQHQDDLIEWAQSMKEVANKLQVPLIDLHGLSKQKVISVGEEKSDQYAESPKGTPKFDRTHLGNLGACVFGSIFLSQLPAVTGQHLAVTTPACE